MESALVQSPMGLGFESQVPQYIYCIFLQVITCDFSKRSTPYSSNLQAPDGLQAKSDGPDGAYTMVPSQHCHRELQRSNACLQQMGLINVDHTYNLGPNPPVVISFSLYFFYLIVFFNLFFIFSLTN